WRRRLNEYPGFKVGVVWKGNTKREADWQRSVPLALFEPLAKVPGVQLVSLQKGDGSEQLAALQGHFPVIDLGPDVDEANGPFMDTAAIMTGLDLVISVDTSVVHLAGALGAALWVPLPFLPEWRWLLAREDSPWYPTLRLFRQTEPGRWQDVFRRM